MLSVFIFGQPFEGLSYPFLDFGQPFKFFAIRLSGYGIRFNAQVSRLLSVYNRFSRPFNWKALVSVSRGGSHIFVNLCLMEKDVFNHIVSSYVLMESKILFTQEKGSNPNVQTPTLPSFYCNSFRCQCGWHHATWKWYTLLNWCLICTFK